MRTSESTDAISKALSSAQAEMKNAALNKVNPHFKNRYADMAAIRDAVVPSLAKHGIAVAQATELDDNGFRLVTRLSHESGQWIESAYPLTIQQNPQAMGSQLTYARRYGLSAIACISSDDDDDATAAANDSKRNISEPRNAKTVETGEQKSAYRARKDGDWDAVMEFRSITNLGALNEWYKANRAKIEAMPPGWQDHFYPIYEDHRAGLKDDVTMAG